MKVDEAFPLEMRAKQLKHWLQVAKPFIIARVVLVICLDCCHRCYGGRRAVKMMKAPGRGYRMPRSVFEENPKSYFRGNGHQIWWQWASDLVTSSAV
ncbi:hypothetical protein U1Q18_014423 [Sarracenia purpurea var. burkii]